MRSTELLTSILLFSAAASAWSPGWGPVGRRENVAGAMERRQDSTSQFDLSYSGVQGNTATTAASSAEETATNSDNNSAETTNTADSSADSSDSATTGSARQTSGGSVTGTKTSGGTKTTKTSSIDPRSPAGGVTMVTPNALSSSYIKIEDWATFAWNYTSVLVKPTAVDVLASCTVNNQLYTIAANVSYSGNDTQTVLWDTGAFQSSATVPLLTETYTLIIHDAAKDVSASASPGYLGVANQFTFGMYTPKPYTPLSDYQCVTCSSAMTLVEKQTLLALVAMASLTTISFGWFTSVAGLW